MTLFSGVNMEPFQAECEDPEAGEEPTHQPSVAILAQAQQGGCPIGPRGTFFGYEYGTLPIQLNMKSRNPGSLGIFLGEARLGLKPLVTN